MQDWSHNSDQAVLGFLDIPIYIGAVCSGGPSHATSPWLESEKFSTGLLSGFCNLVSYEPLATICLIVDDLVQNTSQLPG